MSMTPNNVLPEMLDTPMARMECRIRMQLLAIHLMEASFLLQAAQHWDKKSFLR